MQGWVWVHHRNPIVSVLMVVSGSSSGGLSEMHIVEVELTLEPIISAPIMGAGLGVCPAAKDFVGVHIGWWTASQNPVSPVDIPWVGVCSGSFPEGVLQFCPSYTAACSWIWGQQVLAETYHRGSICSRLQHNHLSSCSHNTLAPSDSLALNLG